MSTAILIAIAFCYSIMNWLWGEGDYTAALMVIICAVGLYIWLHSLIMI
jgi:hypothetical protein